MPIFDYTPQFWEALAAAENARLSEYRVAWNYYKGQQPAPLKLKPGQPNDNLLINLYAYAVDKGVSFLFGKELTFDLDGAQTAETPAETYLAQVWAKNKKTTFLQKVALNGALNGHCFVEIDPQGPQGVPRLINLAAEYVRPFWDPDDIEKVLWYKIQYTGVDRDLKRVTVKRLIERDEASNTWLISRYEQRENAPTFTRVSEMVWPYPFAPIVDWQNLPMPNEYFGAQDIPQVAGQNGINFVASNLQRIICGGRRGDRARRHDYHPERKRDGAKSRNAVRSHGDALLV